jgi:hypothetical protein
MLAELSAQTQPAWTTTQNVKAAVTEAPSDTMQEDSLPATSRARHLSRPSHLLVLPIQCLPASQDFPKQLLAELVKPCLETEMAEATLSVISNSHDSPMSRQLVPHRVSYRVDGLSLLVKSAAVCQSACERLA